MQLWTSIGRYLCPLALTATICGTSSARGAITLSISDMVDSPNEVAVAFGGSFDIKVNLDTTVERALGLTYFIEAPASSNGGGFTILNRNTVGTLFSDLNTPSVTGTLLPDPSASGGTVETFVDLGGDVSTFPNPVNAGSSFIATLTIATNGLLPGVYTLRAGSGTVVTYDNGDLVEPITTIPISSNSYQIRIIPEPDAAVLSIGGLGMLGIFRRRR